MPIRPENRARYPKNWKEIRARIQKRARDKCEWCGLKNQKCHNKYDARNRAKGKRERLDAQRGQSKLFEVK